MTTLPTNIETTYPDRGPGDEAHQQHHDIVHQIINKLTAGPLPAETLALIQAALDARYQPFDGDLAAIAALTTTAYGRALLTLANQAALAAAVGPVPYTVSTTKRHMWFPGTSGNYWTMGTAALAADPSVDWRVECVRPPIPTSTWHCPTGTPFYILFAATGFEAWMVNSVGSTVVTGNVVYPAGFPVEGQPVQVRAVWDAATDTLSLYWRLPTVDLNSDVGWTLATSLVLAGTQASTAAGWAGVSTGNAMKGAIYRIIRRVNGVLNVDINPEVDIANVAPDATVFTPSVGPTVGIFKWGYPADVTRLVSQKLTMEGANTQAAIDSLGLDVARVLGRTNGILTGTGMPEGVVTAPVGTKYIDTAATNGAVEWIKATGTGNTGWQVVFGDTGWRNVAADLMNGFTSPASYELRVRRQNNLVSMVGRLTAPGGQTNYWTAPFGIRGRSAPAPLVITVAPIAGTPLRGAFGATYIVGVFPAPAAATLIDVTGTWPVTESWPTVLPGVAG